MATEPSKEDVQSYAKQGYRKCDDVEGAIVDIQRNFDNKIAEMKEMKKRLEKFDSDIESCDALVKNSFEAVGEAIRIAFETKLNSAEEKEQEDMRLINEGSDDKVRSAHEKKEKANICSEDVDEEIKIINANRAEQIKASKEAAEHHRQAIKDSQTNIMSDAERIDRRVTSKLEELKSKNRQEIEAINSKLCKITAVRGNDASLLSEEPQVMESVDQSCYLVHCQAISECLERIKNEVQKLRFVERQVGGRPYERIDGYIGEWELVKSFEIPTSLKIPWVCGVNSDEEVCLWDIGDYTMYIANITTGEFEKAFEGRGGRQRIISCAPIDTNIIACDKGGNVMFGGDAYRGSVVLYDEKWEVVKKIYVPNDFRTSYTIVFIDADQSGMILAALYKQPNIYVINPTDGEIVETITIQGKDIFGLLQTLSSGDIVLRTENGAFITVSRSGEVKSEVHCDEWDKPWGRVDKLTGALYVNYLDKERNVFVVDEATADGHIEAKRIIEYPAEEGHHPTPFAVTPSGVCVFCNGKKMFVYKKNFVL